jgi:ligand-binding SRPBCC domain-containing protein
MPYLFEQSTALAVSAATAFHFHSDPANITVVMPPTLKLVRLETEAPAREGGLITLECRDWGIIPMRWKCRWKTVQAPTLLVDEMLEGPFACFLHEHRFDPQPDGTCLMTDRVSYQFGRSWWGGLISATGVRLYLRALFTYRHWRTRKWAKRAALSADSPPQATS